MPTADAFASSASHHRHGAARNRRPNVTPRTRVRCRLVCLLVLVGPTLALGSAAEPAPLLGPELEITLTDGRQFHGQWSAASDADQLSLATFRPGMSLVRHFDWQQIQQVNYQGQPLDPAELRQRLLAAQQTAGNAESIPAPLAEGPSVVPPPLAVTDSPVFDASAYHHDQVRSPWEPLTPCPPACPGKRAPSPPRVAALHADAYLANWDRDAEADGLIVYLQPLDIDGQPVTASGHAEFELLANRPGTPDPYAAFPVIGRWTRRLASAQGTPLGARVRLDFQEVLPDVRTDLEAYGSLFVRLVVPGQGTFDASLGTLRIRGYDLLRDRRQLLGHPRFFPGESPGRWQ